ncbi:MAG: glycosyltransferase family 1 protein [Gemmatimonadota bacterium]
MRIGLMLRALDERGGVGVYARNLTEELLALDRHNHYVLLYRSAEQLGRFSHYPNVTERVVRAPGKALWDQIAVPWRLWRDRVDVVFHPKFTVPLLAPCPSLMVLHGAGWFLTDFFGKWDVRYVKLVMPLYLRRATKVLAVSPATKETFNAVFNLPDGLIQTVYFGPASHFRRVENPDRLAEVRARYDLPDRFVFTLTKANGGERKNIAGILEAFRLLHLRTGGKLVIGGKGCERFSEDYGVSEQSYGPDVLFPGWISQEDLPAVYSLADVFLYPSNLESASIPLMEAMACGTPIVTSRVPDMMNVADNAAVFVDPARPDEIAEATQRVLEDPELAHRLGERGLARSSIFSWKKCAQETLDLIEAAAA